MNWNAHFADRARHTKRTAVRELLKVAAQPGMISFAGGLPAPELFPVAQVRQAADAVLDKIGPRALQYGETEGVGELRDWIAGQFTRPQFPLTRANVVIVSGGQQALDLVGRVFLNAGDKVIVENPTYLALLSAWRPLEVQFLPVPSDADGLCVEQLEPLLKKRPKLIYTVPNFQNPQGTTLALDRRAKLAELVRQYGIGLVEDNPYGDLRYDGTSLPHLFELMGANSDRNVIYVGTFSKVLMPGLRVGWVVATEEVIEMIVRAKQAADLHTSTLSQYLTCELIHEGLLESQIPLLRTAYRERRDVMMAALREHFPNEATWTRPAGGMFLMVALPNGLDATEVLQRSLSRQVAFVPGQDFHLEGRGRNTFRLNFSNTSPHLIATGIERLGRVLKEMLTSG